MNKIEKVVKYLPDAFDAFFRDLSKTEILERGAKYVNVKFDKTGSVLVPSIFTDGLSDYLPTQNGVNGGADYAAYAGNTGSGYRDGLAIGGVDAKWDEYKLNYKRGKQFRIDEIDDEESAGILAANLMNVFIQDKVIPEVDAVRFSRIAGATSASLGNRVTESLASLENEIIGKWDNAFAWLQENEVPAEDQIIFINPQVEAIVKHSTELAKYITQTEYNNEAGISFQVSKYNGRPIVVVPSSRFFTDVYCGPNGYRPSANSVSINYAIVSSKATLPIKKLEHTDAFGPAQASLIGFYGYLFNFLMYHDLIIPKNKVPGIYVSVSDTLNAGVVNSLKVATSAGSVQYAWNLDQYFTVPAGLRGVVHHSYSNAYTLGADAEDVTGDTLTNEKDNTATSAQTTAYFALVDGFGKVIATTGSTPVTLTRHA